MSYERDPNRSTGPGAIASRDAVNPRLARRRHARARVMAARDRQLAGYTYGPNGGIVAFGAADSGKDTRPSLPVRPNDPVGGGSPRPPRPLPPRTPMPGRWAIVGTPVTGTYDRGFVVQPLPMPPTVIVDPVGGSTVLPPSKTGGSSGGGGGGGGTWVPPIPLPPGPAMEPPDTGPDVQLGPSGPGSTTLLLLGAAAVGAYLLLRKKPGGSSTP